MHRDLYEIQQIVDYHNQKKQPNPYFLLEGKETPNTPEFHLYNSAVKEIDQK